MERLRKFGGMMLLGCLAMSPAFGAGLTFLSAPGTVIDTVNWVQLGPDGTLISQNFSATSTNSVAVTGLLGSTDGGIIAVVGTSWGPPATGYSNGDSLIWAEDTNEAGAGPVTLSFAAQGGVGAYLQSVSVGQFSASIDLYNGGSLLGSQTYLSDANGDPVFLGATSSLVNITKVVFSGVTCGSFACDPQDFSINTLQIFGKTSATPEPSTFVLAGTFCLLGLMVRRVSKNRERKEVMIKAVPFVAVAAIACLAGQAAFAQNEPVISPGQLNVHDASKASLTALHSFINGQSAKGAALTAALPIWQYQVLSPRDSNTYTGSMVGGNPFNRGGRTTTVKVVLIPLRIAFTGTVRTFDPNSPDAGCLGAGTTAKTLIDNSPIFNTVPNLTMNGVNLGTVTFPDGFQRAAFWQSIASIAPAYHLAFNVTTAATQTITLANNTAGSGATYTIGSDCGTNLTTVDNPPRLAVLDINFVDPILNTIISNLGLTADQFPLFLTYRTVMSIAAPGNLDGCCILGYHSTVSLTPTTANPGQTYGIAEYDNGAFFGGTRDISVLSHEIMEWVNDPSTSNLVPEWGNIGQVDGCVVSGNTHSEGQNNLEVGDPLSGTLIPPITMPNSVVYHPQEQAFYSWFIGGTSVGAGGKYSSNGTFTGFAKNCATGGGTN